MNRVQPSHAVTKKPSSSEVKQIAKTLKSRLRQLSKPFVPSVNYQKYVSMETLNKLSCADWPTEKKLNSSHHIKRHRPVLHHLDLLKQYLTFVASETLEIQFNPNQIEFTFSNQQDLQSPQSTQDHASRLGATLIEMSVHDPLEKIQPPKGIDIYLFTCWA